jgi:dTDP-4-dehydrorhamnose reductase
MLHFFARKAAENEGGGGRIEVSDRWTPCTAFLVDTAAALGDLMERRRPGLYHVEGNPGGLTHYEIARRLAKLHKMDWEIVPVHEPAGCNLLVDDRVRVRPIEERLPS